MNRDNKHIGGSFDDFLVEQNLLEECEDIAIKQILADQVALHMKEKNITKAAMAKRMETSRSALDRLLDPKNESVTLQTMQRAASAIGRRLELQLV
jgi:predicted XRE-type DNA-binding protein